MKISDAENELFLEWKKVREEFVEDGVADEDAYLASPKKILFVMKEANSPGGGDWDLRETLRDGGREATFNNLTRWVEGILSLPDDKPWEKMEVIDEGRRKDALQKIAIVNLKKSPGGHTTNPLELDAVAREDRSFLERQFKIYDPDIIICCGTQPGDRFHELKPYSDSTWVSTKRGVLYFEHKPKHFVILHAHPEARCADNFLYYSLIDAVQEILYQK